MASPLSAADFKATMEKLFGEIQSVKEDIATQKNDQSRLWVAVNRLQTAQLELSDGSDKGKAKSETEAPPSPPLPYQSSHKLRFPRYDGTTDPVV